MNRWRVSGAPLVIAHRGHSVGAPEQTLAAFRAAATLGADMIEADVRRSRDGRLVMMHDATLERTTNGSGRIADFTFDELSEFDAGSWFSPDFAGERIPSLDDLFDLADERDIALCLEVKGQTSDEKALVAELVARAIAARGRLHRDVMACFDHEQLAVAAKAVPGLIISPDRLPERGPSSSSDLIGQARRIGAEMIQHHHEDLSADIVKAVHAAGLAIWVWPPTTADEVQRAYALGVDGLMGDDVAMIVTVVQRHQGDRAGDTSTARPLSAER